MRPVEIDSVPLDLERPPTREALPLPAPIETRTIEWFVATPDRLPEDEDWVLFGLTPVDYEILALNMAEIRRWVEEAMFQLQYYRSPSLDVD